MFQTMEYYSALKRNELQGHEKSRKKFKCIILNEKSQPAKTYTVWFQLYDILGGKIKDES